MSGVEREELLVLAPDEVHRALGLGKGQIKSFFPAMLSTGQLTFRRSTCRPRGSSSSLASLSRR